MDRRTVLRCLLAAPLIVPASRLEFGVPPRRLWRLDLRRRTFTDGIRHVPVASVVDLGFGLTSWKAEPSCAGHHG
jgi:hypothetical protein